MTNIVSSIITFLTNANDTSDKTTDQMSKDKINNKVVTDVATAVRSNNGYLFGGVLRDYVLLQQQFKDVDV